MLFAAADVVVVVAAIDISVSVRFERLRIYEIRISFNICSTEISPGRQMVAALGAKLD